MASGGWPRSCSAARPQWGTNPYTAAPHALFEQVKSLSADRFDDLFKAPDTVASSLFPGPLHMASLLSAVSRDLAASALTSLPPPAGIDRDDWAATIQNMAYRRPYLWRNHRQAVEAGYLERGVSSVVSFPTGAGSQRWQSSRLRPHSSAVRSRILGTDARVGRPNSNYIGEDLPSGHGPKGAGGGVVDGRRWGRVA